MLQGVIKRVAIKKGLKLELSGVIDFIVLNCQLFANAFLMFLEAIQAKQN